MIFRYILRIRAILLLCFAWIPVLHNSDASAQTQGVPAPDLTVLKYCAFLPECSEVTIQFHECIPCIATFDNGSVAVVTAPDTILIVSKNMAILDTINVPYGRPVAMMFADGESVLECLIPVSQHVLIEWRWGLQTHKWTKGRRFSTIFDYYSYKAKLSTTQTSFVLQMAKRLSKKLQVGRQDVENTLMFANKHVAIWRYVVSHVPFLYHFTKDKCTVLDTIVTDYSYDGKRLWSDLESKPPLACYTFSLNPRWHLQKRQFYAVSISEDGKVGYIARVWFDGMYLYHIDVESLKSLCKSLPR